MSKYRVMVVDDDPDIRFVTTGLLGDDFEMVQAESGLDALEKIERYEPDLLLLDVYMPIMDGFATCRSVRRMGDASVPVFFLTGASSEKARAKASDSGSVAFIEKPFDTEALVDNIRGFFTDKRVTPRLKTFTMRELTRIDSTPLRAAETEAEEEATAGGTEQRMSRDEETGGVSPERPASKGEGGGRKRRLFGAARMGVPEDAIPSVDVTGDATARIPTIEELQKKAEEKEREKQRDAEPVGPEDTVYPSLPKKKPFRVVPGEDSGSFEPGAPTTKEPAKPPTDAADDEKRVEKPAVPAPARPKKEAPPAREPEPAKPAAPEEQSPQQEKTQPPQPLAPEMPTIRVRPRRDIPPEVRRKSGSGSQQRPRVLCLIGDHSEMTAYSFGLKGLAEYMPLNDAVEAVEIIARFQPDIVFAHLVARDFSGLQLAQLLKTNPRLSHTEVVFLDTGHETPQQRAAAARLTSNPTVRTPIQEDTVRRAVQNIVSRPAFTVREKKLSYGAYVTEVMQTERKKAEVVRQHREKEFEKMRVSSLGDFMDDLRKAVGDKEIPKELQPKTAQAYYLRS